MWCYTFQQDWLQAYRYADLLSKESRWSKVNRQVDIVVIYQWSLRLKLLFILHNKCNVCLPEKLINKDTMGPKYFYWVLKNGFLFHVLKQQKHKQQCFGPSKNWYLPGLGERRGIGKLQTVLSSQVLPFTSKIWPKKLCLVLINTHSYSADSLWHKMKKAAGDRISQEKLGYQITFSL